MCWALNISPTRFTCIPRFATSFTRHCPCPTKTRTSEPWWTHLDHRDAHLRKHWMNISRNMNTPHDIMSYICMTSQLYSFIWVRHDLCCLYDLNLVITFGRCQIAANQLMIWKKCLVPYVCIANFLRMCGTRSFLSESWRLSVSDPKCEFMIVRSIFWRMERVQVLSGAVCTYVYSRFRYRLVWLK